MKQKKSYKSVPAAAVVKEYRLAIIGIWILHILTVPAARLPYLAGHLRTDNPCKRHL